MEIKVLNKLDGIKEIKEDWYILLQKCGVVPLYLNPTWVYNWFKFLGKRCTPFIITGSIENKLVFILPLSLRSFLLPFFRILHFPGYPGSDHLGFIVDTEYKKEVSKKLYIFLKECKSQWDICDFAEIPEDRFNGILSDLSIHTSSKEFKIVDGPKCPYLKIDGDWEDFYRKRKKKKFRYNIDRSRRQLEDLGTVQFKTLRTWEEIEHYIPQIFEIHRKRWEGYYTGSMFSKPSGEKFYKIIAKEYQTKGWIDIAILLLNGKVIAYSYSFVWGEKYFYYNPAYNPKFSRYSPGSLLFIYILERLFNSGFKQFDFGRGDLSYKSYWTDGIRQNKKLVFASPHFKGKVCLHLYLSGLYLKDILRRSIFLRILLSKLSFIKRQ